MSYGSYTSSQYVEVVSPDGYDEIEVQFELSCVCKGRPGKMYLANGDPGYPDEPAEFELNDIYMVCGHIDAKSDGHKIMVKVTEDTLRAVYGSEVYSDLMQKAFEEAHENFSDVDDYDGDY